MFDVVSRVQILQNLGYRSSRWMGVLETQSPYFFFECRKESGLLGEMVGGGDVDFVAVVAVLLLTFCFV